MDFISSNPVNELEKILQSHKLNKILIITGQKSYFKSGANKLIKNLLKKKDTFYYFKKSYLPIINELKKIVLITKKFKPDLIIAIGGGTVLDYAKSSNVIDDLNDINEKIINSSLKIKKKKCKLLAIPTTAGSGAEVTSNSVIYINKIKYSIENNLLKPDYFLLFPQLVIGCSKIIKASSGFDAIAQSLESLIAKKSNITSVRYAQKSLKLSLKYYLQYLKNPSKENSFKMSLAANLSGKAINISKTTAPHAISYPFSYHFGLPHGHAVSLTLREFLKFNFQNKNNSAVNYNLNNRFKKMLEITNTKSIYELDLFLKYIQREANLISNFKVLGINVKRDYAKILSGVNARRLNNNPININKFDLKKIIFQIQ